MDRMNLLIKQISVWVCFLLLAFPSCDMKDRKGSSEALKEEIKERELKRVTEVEIFEAATKVGEQIAMASQKTLATNLKTAISQQGVEYAIEFCKLQAMPLTDSLSKKFAAQIRRTSIKIRNPANRPNDLESQILDAYQYNVENGLDLAANLQRIDQDYLLYTHPIVLNNPLCLNCHGKPGDQITDEHAQLLTSLYPDDEAVGYQLGELRGMWSIVLSQKQLVLSL